MTRAVLVVVLVLTLCGCGPSASQRARDERFQQALDQCDQLPDIGGRVDCWSAAYASRREEGG
jgi:hypothetical protein